MTTTATVINLHQPRIDGTATRCSAPDCYHVTFGYIRPDLRDDPEEQERAKRMFREAHTAEHEPGRAPSIEVEYRIHATCSVCPDGGDVEQIESDTIECSKCKTTWDERGLHGTRVEPDPDRYIAARDARGGIRLHNGTGLLVADADHTRPDVLGWFIRSEPGRYREQYRAALALLNTEQGWDTLPTIHPDEQLGSSVAPTTQGVTP